MRFFRRKSALVVGAIGLAIAVGAVGIFATQRAGAAFAQGGETELDGVIETLPASGVLGTWQVSGRTVVVNEATEIDDEGQTLAPGLRVEIEGTDQPDGSLLASEIEVRERDDDGGPSVRQSDDDNGPSSPSGPQAGDDDDGGNSSAVSQGDDDDGGQGSATSQGDDDGGPASSSPATGQQDDDD